MLFKLILLHVMSQHFTHCILQLPTSTNIGTPDHPCDQYSMWRRVSFVRNDYQWDVENNLQIIDLGSNGPYKLVFNRWARTIVDKLEIASEGYSNYTFDPNFVYTLCNTPEDTSSNGRLYIRLEPQIGGDEPCVIANNPLTNFDGYESSIGNLLNLPDEYLKPIDHKWTSDEDLVFQLQTSLFDSPSLSSSCADFPLVPEFGDEPIFGKLSDGTWLIYDPRLDLISNTISSPKEDGGNDDFKVSGGETRCSNVPRTFLNEDECHVSSDACRPSSNS